MPNFKIVKDSSEITVDNNWVSSTKRNSNNRFDEKGHKVGLDYKGCQYQIIDKRERTFSNLELFGRGLLGMVAVICTVCLGLFLKSVRNLFTKSKETIRFAVLVQAGNLPTPINSINHPTRSDKETIKLTSIRQAAPWKKDLEPTSLPEGWKKHEATQNITVAYGRSKVNIPEGDVYFTFQGKVAIGWHGSYNPPQDMGGE